jgi:hypothetical protein
VIKGLAESVKEIPFEVIRMFLEKLDVINIGLKMIYLWTVLNTGSQSSSTYTVKPLQFYANRLV